MKDVNKFFTKKKITFAISVFALQVQGQGCSNLPLQVRNGAKLKQMDGDRWNKYIKNIQDISEDDVLGKYNILCTAVKYNNIEYVDCILRRLDQDAQSDNQHAKQNFQNSFDVKGTQTALGLAIANANINIIKLLLASPYIDKTKVEKNAPNALIFAMKRKWVVRETSTTSAIIYQILESCAAERGCSSSSKSPFPNINLDDKDEDTGNTGLHLAVDFQDYRILQKLTSMLEVRQFFTKNKKNRSPLHKAAGSIHYGEKNGRRTLLHLIDALKEKDPSGNWVNQLLEQDHMQKSVFANIYIKSTWYSVITTPLKVSEVFEELLSAVSPFLKNEHWERIVSEIETFSAFTASTKGRPLINKTAETSLLHSVERIRRTTVEAATRAIGEASTENNGWSLIRFVGRSIGVNC